MSCARCGASDQPGRFCHGCGAKLPPRATARMRSRWGAIERRTADKAR